jgi:hypothetical protein
MRWIRQRAAEITITTLALAAGVGVYIYAHRDEGSLEASKERGAVVVDALERHRTAAGTYPESLEQLVPQYLDSIAPPSWGQQRWRYRRYTAADVTDATVTETTVYFQLSVAANENGYPVLYYDVTARRWVLNN